MYVVIFLCTLMYMLTKAYAVLPNYLPVATGGTLSRDEIIQAFFQSVYAYRDIVAVLFMQQGIHLLKRLLKKMCLRRKRSESNLLQCWMNWQLVVNVSVTQECGGGLFISSTTFVHLKRKKVLELMWILDSEGVQRRKAHWAHPPTPTLNIQGNHYSQSPTGYTRCYVLYAIA